MTSIDFKPSHCGCDLFFINLNYLNPILIKTLKPLSEIIFRSIIKLYPNYSNEFIKIIFSKVQGTNGMPYILLFKNDFILVRD